jgi:hypothetical protein
LQTASRKSRAHLRHRLLLRPPRFRHRGLAVGVEEIGESPVCPVRLKPPGERKLYRSASRTSRCRRMYGTQKPKNGKARPALTVGANSSSATPRRTPDAGRRLTDDGDQRDRRPRRGADRGRTGVTARQADLRSPPRLPVAVAQCRQRPRTTA